MGGTGLTAISPDVLNLLNSSNRILGLQALPSVLAAPVFKPPAIKGAPGLTAPKGFKGDPNSPIGVIVKNAGKFGLDPAAVLAYALEESSAKYGAVGDQGTSFGPFQAHIGGAAGSRSPQAASAWANSPQGLIEMMGMMSRTPAKGLTGAAAVRAIYQYFGKGTPAAVPRGLARYGEAQKMISQTAMRAALRSSPDVQAQLNQHLDGQAGGQPVTQWTYPKMVTGTPSAYNDLTFAGHVDWVHVDTGLLAKLNALGHMLGVKINVISGYRAPGYISAGYNNDPHMRGVAVDAYINGVPIGDYKGAFKVLQQLGLQSGAVANFYQGKPDPEHVQLPNAGINKKIHARRITA